MTGPGTRIVFDDSFVDFVMVHYSHFGRSSFVGSGHVSNVDFRHGSFFEFSHGLFCRNQAFICSVVSCFTCGNRSCFDHLSNSLMNNFVEYGNPVFIHAEMIRNSGMSQ